MTVSMAATAGGLGTKTVAVALSGLGVLVGDDDTTKLRFIVLSCPGRKWTEVSGGSDGTPSKRKVISSPT